MTASIPVLRQASEEALVAMPGEGIVTIAEVVVALLTQRLPDRGPAGIAPRAGRYRRTTRPVKPVGPTT